MFYLFLYFTQDEFKLFKVPLYREVRVSAHYSNVNRMYKVKIFNKQIYWKKTTNKLVNSFSR